MQGRRRDCESVPLPNRFRERARKNLRIAAGYHPRQQRQQPHYSSLTDTDGGCAGCGAIGGAIGGASSELLPLARAMKVGAGSV